MKLLAGLATAIVIVTLFLLGPHAVFDVIFGWAAYLHRVLPRIDPNRPTVIVGIVAVVLLTLGIHWAGRRTFTAWRWRWAGMAMLATGLLFTIGVAMIGIVHQTAWLATSDEPIPGRKLARSYSNENNFLYIGLGVSDYSDINRNLPSGGTFTADGTGKHGWVTFILPYMNYYAPGIDMNKPWNDPANRINFKCILPTMINPDNTLAPFEDNEGYGLAHYAANGRVMGPNTAVSLDSLPAGLSGTALIGEINDGFRPWGHPRNWRDPADGVAGGPIAFGNSRNTGATFLMADGSIRFLSRDVDPAVLNAIAGPRR